MLHIMDHEEVPRSRRLHVTHQELSAVCPNILTFDPRMWFWIPPLRRVADLPAMRRNFEIHNHMVESKATTIRHTVDHFCCAKCRRLPCGTPKYIRYSMSYVIYMIYSKEFSTYKKAWEHTSDQGPSFTFRCSE